MIVPYSPGLYVLIDSSLSEEKLVLTIVRCVDASEESWGALQYIVIDSKGLLAKWWLSSGVWRRLV